MSGTAEAQKRVSGPTRPLGGSFEQEEHLTYREREILGHFADGLGTEEIARRLSISKVTVRNHAQRILSKLRVHSRLAAVALGYRNGLLKREPDSPDR